MFLIILPHLHSLLTTASPKRTSLRLMGLLASGLLLVLTGCAGSGASKQGSGAGMHRVISSERAPAAIGPYSQAVQVGDALYLSGQIGIDPATGILVPGGIRAETRQVLNNLRAVTETAGFSLSDVVQVQVYMTDLAEYTAMNEEYAAYFLDRPPARATVQVAALPRGARVEIMATAVR